MSIAIDTVTIGAIEDRRLAIASGNAARVMSIGTSWNQIRIGVRWCFDDAAGDIVGTPRMYLGVLSNPANPLTNGPVGTTCSHFVGSVTMNGSWTRNAGPPVYYSVTGPAYAAAKKIGNVLTTSNMNTGGRISGAPSTNRPMLVTEITKGSPNFTVQNCVPFTLTTDLLTGDVMQAISLPTMTDVLNYLNFRGGANAYVNNTIPTIAVSEATNGFLNAVCVGFDKATVMHISDLMVFKVS